ncbi:uncharacterized protein LOC111949116 isoform X2 [Oryzias latipes]|uniref:uncharacterized protein LOC111949116 isoform X2 n=1 Tax=Oryzias latipes TaxID=8090 RepID=UPI0005CC809D|nr:uncharacterized protein LOC111949116 isoform X2 [Oryzias latipes]
MSVFKEESDEDCSLQNTIRIPGTQRKVQNKWKLFNEMNTNLDPAEPEPQQMKEEPEELCCNEAGEQEEFKSELFDRQHHLGSIIMNPVRKVQTTGVQHQHVCEDDEEWQLYKQERHSSLDQAEPELSQIKEEPEELCSNQEGEQLLLNQETDVKMEFKSDLLDHQHHQRTMIRIPVVNLQSIE